jgi:hypothetical protein
MQQIELDDPRLSIDLQAARLALGAALAEAFRAEREANIARRGFATPPAPPQINRHERRRLAALARKF